ncbi:MAG: sulfatase [Actinobacteria bacterium]|nr:sulfatase [Actinomycetota bacterium]
MPGPRAPARLLAVALGAAVALAALTGCGGGHSAKHAQHVQLPGVPPLRRIEGRGNSPNIVFVLTDDLSWNLVRYMPHVLRMERHGVTFTNYFVTDSLCCPSRASIFTGRYPHDTRVFGNVGPDGGFNVFHARGEDSASFAAGLQAAGYRTAMMGKYLNGYHPAATVGGVKAYFPPFWTQWDVGGEAYAEFGYHLNQNGKVVKYGHSARDYLTDVIARKGAAFVRQSAAARQPFMLELATFAPHAPYTPAPRDLGDFPGLTAARSPAFDRANANPPSWLADHPPLRRPEIRRLGRWFRRRTQAVQAVDRMIGSIERTLAETSQSRNTYIVFSSDNGYHLGEHRLLAGKLTAFDTDIRVPLVVTGPKVPQGRRIAKLAENIDLNPTFLRLAGLAVPGLVEGRSLVRLLHGDRTQTWRRAVLVEHHGPDVQAGDPDYPNYDSANPTSYEAIRMADSLYVEYVNGDLEYYDLSRDPFELRNTAATLPVAKRRQLHSMLASLERCHDAATCWAASSAGGPPAPRP